MLIFWMKLTEWKMFFTIILSLIWWYWKTYEFKNEFLVTYLAIELRFNTRITNVVFDFKIFKFFILFFYYTLLKVVYFIYYICKK